ncbi:hypothetical protein J5N97_015025 [Dioscorea zingiberensis]|uniref:Methyltransferase n=1 Tax=Dioscorea zingiberensis TaxID=325984 RepID=A0A9D5CTG9_9LILI|nr:hypothetical protein J5N97_015025 [Dioscorea zingiberensis]
MDAYVLKKELLKAESRYWNDIIEGYVRVFHLDKMKLRNVMDMRAGFGGFAAALIDLHIDCWVMNVVPTSGPDTLPVVYDRGLIGVNHDWCNIPGILLEMDRILRPGGHAYIRDSRFIIDEVKEITKAMGWRTELRDTAEGPYASRKVLMCQKQL